MDEDGIGPDSATPDGGDTLDDGGDPADVPPQFPLRVIITVPANESVGGTVVAVNRIDRFGFPMTIPYIQAGRTLMARAEITQGPCPDRATWILASTDGSIETPAELNCGPELHQAGRQVPLLEGGVDTVTRVGLGDIFIVLGESTSEGYGVLLGAGAYQADQEFSMDRWDRVPPGTASKDGRTFPQVGPTSLTPEESGCGAPTSLGCPIGATMAGGPPVAGPVFFSGYGPRLADLLSERLGYPVLIWNLAYGGHTTAALLREPGMGLHHSSVTRQIEALQPNRALILNGVNDGLCPSTRCVAGDVGCYALCGSPEANFRELVDWAAGWVGGASNVFLADPTCYAGMQPVVIAARAIRDERQLLVGPELYQFFLNNPVLLSDGVHPNLLGYDWVARLWAHKVATPALQRTPQLSYLPSVTSSPATGVIATQGVLPFGAVWYTFSRPDGSLSYGPALLLCSETGTATADAYGLCSFAFVQAVLDPPGLWNGAIEDGGGGQATATLTVTP